MQEKESGGAAFARPSDHLSDDDNSDDERQAAGSAREVSGREDRLPEECLPLPSLAVRPRAARAGGQRGRRGPAAYPPGLSGLNFALMRFARDISRAKARRRRFNQRYALVPLLLGKEEPLPLGDPDSCVGCISFTRDELAEFDGRPLPDGSPSPLYLSVLGRVYDVSSGGAFYGPGKSYHKLVGKDATRAFCTGCLAPSCLISSTAHLSETQRRGASPYPRTAHLSRRRRSAPLPSPGLRREAHRWVELYEWHDKYTLVGRLREEAADPAEEEMALFHALEAELSGNHRPFEM